MEKTGTIGYMAIDQYGQTYHGLQHPRKMDAKFTPGPWSIGTGYHEMPLFIHADAAPVGERLVTSVSTPNHAANAHLIAAAPEMYECCEAALALLEDDSKSPRRIGANIRGLQAALAKARGEAS